MRNDYLRAFVIGSSCIVFLPYFYAVSNFDPKKFNFNYKYYTFLAPIALGLMNLFSLIIANLFHLSNRLRFLVMSIIAPSMVLFVITYFKIYNYTKSEWESHIIKLYILYFVVFNIIIATLDKYV